MEIFRSSGRPGKMKEELFAVISSLAQKTSEQPDLISTGYFVKCLYPTNLRRTIAGSFCGLPYTGFLNLSVVQYLLMSFVIGLLAPVFTQRMSAFNSLLLSLAATQPVLM